MQLQAVMKNWVSDMERVEEMTAVFNRFGDAQSTLLDQYERLSFEVQLNQAMLGRSLSEPAVKRHQAPLPPPLVGKPVRQGKRGRESGFRKVIKKLFRPILGKKGERKEGIPSDRKDSLLKAFSKSLRVPT